jgi:hypothetical protein
MATIYSALKSVNDYSAETTYRVDGKINVKGYPAVDMRDMFAPNDGTTPSALSAAFSLGQRFTRIFSNPASDPQIKSVDLEFDLTNERRTARLESARTDVTEARPGDEIMIESVLRPYRGARILRRIPVRIPTSTPKGTLRILVCDGNTLDYLRGVNPAQALRLDLRSTIELLNKEHANNDLYVTILEPGPQAMVDDKVMPSIPLSVMNVMDGMRGTQEMTVMAESSIGEDSLPLDYVVSGAQIVNLDVK